MTDQYVTRWLNEPNACKYNCTKHKTNPTENHVYYTFNERKYLKSRPFLGTRRYDASTLFTKLVDYCKNNGCINPDESLMLSSLNKDHFYNFVFEQSDQSMTHDTEFDKPHPTNI